MSRQLTPGRLLNCGCTRPTAAEYTCLNCGNTRCYEHRDNAHICPECEGCGFKHGYPLHRRDGRRLVEVGVAP